MTAIELINLRPQCINDKLPTHFLGWREESVVCAKGYLVHDKLPNFLGRPQPVVHPFQRVFQRCNALL